MMSNPIMSKDDFILTVVMSILPACADKLEDFPFRQLAKKRQNEVVTAIRRQDKLYMDKGNLELFDQQAAIQIAFLQWVDESYKKTIES